MKSGRGPRSWAALFRKGRAGSSALANAVPNDRYETFCAYTLKIPIVRELVQASPIGRLMLTSGPAAVRLVRGLRHAPRGKMGGRTSVE